MKPVFWMGNSRQRLARFPQPTQRAIGAELRRVQSGLDPANWKPMARIGAGAREIRVRDAAGAWRLIYVARLADIVYVLHVFQKKSAATAKPDIELATRRYRMIEKERQ